jgi:hypothetical protein
MLTRTTLPQRASCSTASCSRAVVPTISLVPRQLCSQARRCRQLTVGATQPDTEEQRSPLDAPQVCWLWAPMRQAGRKSANCTLSSCAPTIALRGMWPAEVARRCMPASLHMGSAIMHGMACLFTGHPWHGLKLMPGHATLPPPCVHCTASNRPALSQLRLAAQQRSECIVAPAVRPNPSAAATTPHATMPCTRMLPPSDLHPSTTLRLHS